MNLTLTRRRDVPWAVRLVVLFGGVLQPLGWFFFGFGMIFVWVFVPKMDLTSWWQFRGELQQVTGLVRAVTDTGFSEGGSKSQRGTPVKRYDYEFTVGGEKFSAGSYDLNPRYSVGDTVTVEYPAGNPVRARIVGMRSAPVSSIALFVVIFPLVGLGLVAYSLRTGWRALRLLVQGELTRGRLVAKAPTNMTVNKRLVFKLTFEFTDQAGQPQRAEARTHQPEQLEDAAEEWLLYDSWRPDQAVLLDNLPGQLSLNAAGALVLGGRRTLVWAVLAPVFAVVANGVGIWLTMRR